MSSIFGQIPPSTPELSAPWGYNEKNLVTNLALSFLIGCSSFLQVTRKTIKSRKSLKFGQTGLLTADLAALERLKNL